MLYIYDRSTHYFNKDDERTYEISHEFTYENILRVKFQMYFHKKCIQYEIYLREKIWHFK